MKTLTKLRWRIRRTPRSDTFHHGVPEQWGEADYEPHELEHLMGLRRRLDDPNLTDEEKRALVNEFDVLHEMKVLLGARMLTDEEAQERGFKLLALPAPVEPQEAPSQDSLFSGIDTSSPAGEAMQRAWEAQAQKPRKSVERDNVRRAAAAAIDIGSVGRHHAAPHPTERAAAIKAAGRTGSQRRLIFEAFGRAGEQGLIDEEIAAVPQVADTAHRTRRHELVEAGIVFDSGRTRPTASGEASIVWALTPLGQAAWEAE